jgi:hypothetical protein
MSEKNGEYFKNSQHHLFFFSFLPLVAQVDVEITATFEIFS